MARNQLSQLFVLANEFKEGDLNVGGTRDHDVRPEARGALAALSLEDISRTDFAGKWNRYRITGTFRLANSA